MEPKGEQPREEKVKTVEKPVDDTAKGSESAKQPETQPAKDVEKPAQEPAGNSEQQPTATTAPASTTPAPATAPASAKKKSPLLPILLVILALGSAVGVFFLVRALQKPEVIVDRGDEPSSESPAPEDQAAEPIFTAENLPRIDASLATQPLMDALIKNFTGETPAELGREYSNTHPAYVDLIDGKTDLIIVTEPSSEELELAASKGVELEVTKIVNEGFTFFVNKENPVSDVSFDDVAKIYTGEITNWKQLGGNDAEIIAYQRPENSGSQTGLYNLVLKGKPVKIPTVLETAELSMAGIIDYVATYENAMDAIGYGFYYYVNTMHYNDNIKYLAINGVAPTYETIQNGSYPILSAYYIVTRKDDTNEQVAKLKEAMLSVRGQAVTREAGYVPVGE